MKHVGNFFSSIDSMTFPDQVEHCCNLFDGHVNKTYWSIHCKCHGNLDWFVWFFFQCHNIMVYVLFTDPTQLAEILARWVADAHLRTCLYSSEHIADVLRKQALDISKVTYYKNMVSSMLFAMCHIYGSSLIIDCLKYNYSIYIP